MTLYFETEWQGISFLLLCAVGFFSAMLFEGVNTFIPAHLKMAADILFFLLAGLLFLFTLFVMREGTLRLFHWFALLVGVIIYMLGIRRLVSFCLGKWRGRKREKIDKGKQEK